jgi:hypothetical protein
MRRPLFKAGRKPSSETQLCHFEVGLLSTGEFERVTLTLVIALKIRGTFNPMLRKAVTLS